MKYIVFITASLLMVIFAVLHWLVYKPVKFQNAKALSDGTRPEYYRYKTRWYSPVFWLAFILSAIGTGIIAMCKDAMQSIGEIGWQPEANQVTGAYGESWFAKFLEINVPLYGKDTD